MVRPFSALLLTAVLGVAVPSLARAEVFQLLDNTKVNGKLLHFFDGLLVIEAAGGEKITLPREKVKSITFKLPPARPEYSTPQKTFELWRASVLKSNVTQVIDCYALMYQGMLAQQLGDKNEEFKKLKGEVSSTRFSVKGSQVKGETATLKIAREKGTDIETASLNFVLENGEWKMRP